MPLRGTYPNLPAVPVDEAGVPDTLARLANRQQQELQAKQGLTQKLTIGGETRRAYAFLFESPTPAVEERREPRARDVAAREPPGERRRRSHERIGRQDLTPVDPTAEPLSLEHPEQFSISWTNFPGVYEVGSCRPWPAWASSLTDADAATNQFWPMIAEHGFGYNLIIPERVTQASGPEPCDPSSASAWDSRVRSALERPANLYVIDMSRFESLQPQTVNGAPRFTPATITLLIRNPRTRQTLRPVAIIVSGNQGSGRTGCSRGRRPANGAWLYALQAAKASVTRLRRLARARLSLAHRHRGDADDDVQHAAGRPIPIYQLLAPQSKFAIPFDDVAAGRSGRRSRPRPRSPPPEQFLGLCNDYAAGRSYFDDDPHTTLSDQLGLREGQFSVDMKHMGPLIRSSGACWTMWDLVQPVRRRILFALPTPPTPRSRRTSRPADLDRDLRPPRTRAAAATSAGSRRSIPRAKRWRRC